jgi:hypothetical protein
VVVEAGVDDLVVVDDEVDRVSNNSNRRAGVTTTPGAVTHVVAVAGHLGA